MDARSAVIPVVQTVLAAGIGVLAVIGMFGTGSPDEAPIVGGSQFALFVVLPLVGIVMLGLFDWQMGRGSAILRAADVAVFVLATLELSLGTSGIVRWLVGAVALLAATGLAATFLITPPRRAGFRR
jgi:hypothetical protein